MIKLFNRHKDNSANTPVSSNNPGTGPALNLTKHQESLDRVILNLSKKNNVNMEDHTARVAMVIDYSGSMMSMYQSGKVQDLINRLLPISLRFDDNGELEIWAFSNDCYPFEAITIKNYENYVDDYIRGSGMRMGGTEYAPALREVCDLYHKKEPSKVPAFVIFITDGANSDERATDKIVRELSRYNIFVQFVGIGSDYFQYLRKLDTLDGRERDNTGFISVADINKLSDDELYEKLLSEYVEWLKGNQ